MCIRDSSLSLSLSLVMDGCLLFLFVSWRMSTKAPRLCLYVCRISRHFPRCKCLMNKESQTQFESLSVCSVFRFLLVLVSCVIHRSSLTIPAADITSGEEIENNLGFFFCIIISGVQLQHSEDSHTVNLVVCVISVFPSATELWHGLQEL